jgi:hypothetical protein
VRLADLRSWHSPPEYDRLVVGDFARLSLKRPQELDKVLLFLLVE